MRFQDLPVPILSFRLRSKDDVPYLKPGRPLPVKYVKPSNAVLGEFDLFANGSIVHAEPIDKSTSSRLDSELALGRAYLAQIEPRCSDGSFELRMAFFFQKQSIMGDVEIAVDEYVLERFKDLNKVSAKKGVDAVRSQMEWDFNFKHGDECHFFIIAGSALDSDLDLAESAELREAQKESGNEEASIENGAPPPNVLAATASSFGIVGRDVFFAATEKKVAGIGDVFVASKMTRRENRSGRSVRLARGRLKFSDLTETGAIATAARAQVEALSYENSTYLRKWDEYGDQEGTFLLDKARKYGVLFYSGAVSELDETTTVQLVGSSVDSAFTEMAVSGIESVDLVTEIPSYLDNPEMPFEGFVAELMAENREQRASGRSREKRKTYEVVSFNEGSNKLTLRAHGLPQSGQLILSIGGEAVQIKRRAEARKRIRDCESANPQLALILEPGEQITSLRLPSRQAALNSSVKRKVFPKNPPTDSQVKAIDIALNTPDIALIQGPPGTGKTTVITAIVERLNQICAEKGVNVKGQILLSGFQHDAVENMISRMSLNGLPCVPKFGKSSADKGAGRANIYEGALAEWCHDVAERIRNKNPKLDEAGKSTHAQMLALQYSKAPSASLAIELLREIVEGPVSITGTTLRGRAQAELANQMELSEIGNAESPLLSVRLLRVKSDSFLDDGPDRAGDVLDALYDRLQPRERRLLSKASAWNTDLGVPPFIKDLVQLKAKLLERLSTPPVFHVDKPNETVLALAEEFIAASRKPRRSDSDEKLRILSEFVTDLENNHYGMVDAVAEYSFAFSATCQQSASMMMLEAKAVDNKPTEFVYEYVIIDEAARVAPRDLMIPMSQGKKIILVGDHRQLPHIIDMQVEEAIKHENADMADLGWLEKSMFEQLFTERVGELEKDGVCRHVTLDTQFRMHPLLGDFISRNFYERYSKGVEKVKSGLDARYYEHNLPGTDNKPIAWIDVPRFKGKELRNSNSSLYRQAEVDAIVAQIEEWLATDEGRDLTYGVISFYKGQTELIKAALGQKADGSKIRVGTVDSFQGMEFDVVFLSMVRTLPDGVETHELGLEEVVEQVLVPREEAVEERRPSRGGLLGRIRNQGGQETIGRTMATTKTETVRRKIYKPREIVWPTGDPAEAKQARKLFGFLTMYNRLNVSMSRQKRMLVVVGDSNLLATDLADRFIPGLVDFYLLCSAEGVMLPCK